MLERRSGTLWDVRTTAQFLALVSLLPFLPGGCFGAPARTVTPPARDATAALQAALDRGGRIFLPRLPDGKCYRTRGLWVNKSGTELTSDGACLEAIGPGPVRLQSPDGDPITSSAVLFISRAAGGLRPLLVKISGLKIVVPRQAASYGIAVFGDFVTLRNVDVTGAPVDALVVGGRGTPPVLNLTVDRCGFLGGRRNVVSIVSSIGMKMTSSLLTGASDDYRAPGTDQANGNPSAGIDIEPDDPDDPILNLEIRGNTIEQNAGPGILLALSTADGLPHRATGIAIVSNRILSNDLATTPPLEGGIAFQGGQADGKGVVSVVDNVITGNGGAGLQGHPTEGTVMRVLASGNDLRGNRGGKTSFVRIGGGSHLASAQLSTRAPHRSSIRRAFQTITETAQVTTKRPTTKYPIMPKSRLSSQAQKPSSRANLLEAT